MQINKDSAIWHAFGYHNAFNENNEDIKEQIIGNNILQGFSYIPFLGTVLLAPSLISAIYNIRVIEKNFKAGQMDLNMKTATEPYYRGMILRAFFQAIPGSCLILIPVDIVFSALRYKEIITE